MAEIGGQKSEVGGRGDRSQLAGGKVKSDEGKMQNEKWEEGVSVGPNEGGRLADSAGGRQYSADGGQTLDVRDRRP